MHGISSFSCAKLFLGAYSTAHDRFQVAAVFCSDMTHQILICHTSALIPLPCPRAGVPNGLGRSVYLCY